MERLLTVADVPDVLSLSEETVRAMIRSGELPAIRPTGKQAIRIRPSELAALLERRREEGIPVAHGVRRECR